MSETLDVQLELYVRAIPELVVGPEGNVSFDELLEHYRKRNQAAYPEEGRQRIQKLF